MATPGELPLVLALTRASFTESARTPHPSSALRETLPSLRSDYNGMSVVFGLDASKPVSVARYRIEGEALRFWRLAVLPARRGEGRGRALLAWLEAAAAEAGCRTIVCTARSQFPDNRGFYTSRGYVQTSADTVYGVPGLRAHMKKSLLP